MSIGLGAPGRCISRYSGYPTCFGGERMPLPFSGLSLWTVIKPGQFLLHGLFLGLNKMEGSLYSHGEGVAGVRLYLHFVDFRPYRKGRSYSPENMLDVLNTLY